MDDLGTDLVVTTYGQPLGEAPSLLFLYGLTDSGRAWPEAVARSTASGVSSRSSSTPSSTTGCDATEAG